MIYLKDLESILNKVPYRLYLDGFMIYDTKRHCIEVYGDYIVEELELRPHSDGYTIRLSTSK